MRCLFLDFNYPDQGTYLRAEALARVFVARGHDVTLACVSPWRRLRPEWRAMNVEGRGTLTRWELPKWVPLDLLDPADGWTPIDLMARTWHALTARYDFVYAFEHKPTSCWPAWLQRRLKGAFWLHDHCDPWGGPDGIYKGNVENNAGFRAIPWWKKAPRRMMFRADAWLETRIPRRADAVTVISALLRDEMLAAGVAPEKLLRIYTPAPIGHLKRPAKEDARAALSIPETTAGDATRVMGFAANFCLEEDALWPRWRAMLDAVPSLRLAIVGPGYRRVPDWARAEDSRVMLPGFVPFDKLGDWFAASDLLWLPLEPTRYNAGRFPHKFFDYLAAGRAVAVSDVGDVGSLARDHRVGVVGADLDMLTRDSIALLQGDDEALREIGERARRTAETVFSPEAIGEQLVKFLAQQQIAM